MPKDRSAEDIISEAQYNSRMTSVPSSPEDDSPGDSDLDLDTEFEMGLEYIPDEREDPEEAPDLISNEAIPSGK